MHLEAVGLADVEREGPGGWKPEYSCHELVRERIRIWMEERPGDRGELGAEAIRLAYAERLQQTFRELPAQEHVRRAGGVPPTAPLVYLVQAGAYSRLGGFAGVVVTGTSDPRLLERLIPHLEAAASSAPEGSARWRCLRYLGDALKIVLVDPTGALPSTRKPRRRP